MEVSSLPTTIDQILGVWELVTIKVGDENGVLRQWAENPHGYIIYTDVGIMHAAVNGKPGTDIQFGQQVSGSIGYTARYELTNKNTVLHHFTNCVNRSRLGKTYERGIYIEDGHLILTSETPASWIKWRKINSSSDLTIITDYGEP